MTTLNDLINSTSKLPDISQFNYAKNNAADMDKTSADQAYRAFVEGHARQIALRGKEDRNRKTVIGGIASLLSGMGSLAEAADEKEKRKIKRENIAKMQEGDKGIRRANLAEKYNLTNLNIGAYDSETSSLPPWDINLQVSDKNYADAIEYNKLNQAIKGEIDILPDSWEKHDLQLDDQLKVAEAAFSKDAKTLLETTKTLMNQLRHEEFFVEGYSEKNGLVTLEQAIENRLTAEDGSSIAERLKDELYSEIFHNLGGHKIPYSVLHRQYYPEISKTREVERMQEGLEARARINQAHESKELEDFILGITGGDFESYLAGTSQLKGTDGALFRLQGAFDVNYAEDEIIANLEKAYESGALKAEDFTRILGGLYYHKGSKERVSLEKLSPKIFRKVDRMLQNAKGELALEGVKFSNYFQNKYLGKMRDAISAWQTENNGRTPKFEDITEIMKKVLPEARNDPYFQTSPTGTLFVQNLGMHSPEITKILNSLPYIEQQEDATTLSMIADAKLRGDWLAVERLQGELNNPGLLKDNKISKEQASNNVAIIDDAFNKTDGFPAVIKEYIDDNEVPAKDARRIRINLEKYYKARYAHYYDIDPDGAQQKAWDETIKALEAGEFQKTTPTKRLENKEDKERIQNNIRLAKEQYTQTPNKLDFLNRNEPYPGEIEAFNYYSQTGKLPPLFRQLAKLYGNLNGEQFMLIRMEKFHKMEYTDEMVAAFAEDYSYTTINDKGQEVLVPFNVRQEPWFSKQSLGMLKSNVEENLNEIEKRDRAFIESGGVDGAAWTVEQTIEARKNLDFCPLGNSVMQYAVNSKDINFIFESLKNRRAVKTTGYNYIVDNRGKQIKLDKPLEQHTLSELAIVLQQQPIGGVGIFGMKLQEIQPLLANMDNDPNTQLFDQSFQEELMFERMKFVANTKNQLSIIDFPRLSRHNKKIQKRFLEIMNKGTIKTSEFQEAPEGYDQGAPIYVDFVESPWHDVELLSPAIVEKLNERIEQRSRRMGMNI